MLDDHQAPNRFHLLVLLDVYKLPNVLQPMPVQRDLIVNLVRLSGDTIKTVILTFDLLAHMLSNVIDSLSAEVQCLPDIC